jgi:hypothetical protein
MREALLYNLRAVGVLQGRATEFWLKCAPVGIAGTGSRTLGSNTSAQAPTGFCPGNAPAGAIVKMHLDMSRCTEK